MNTIRITEGLDLSATLSTDGRSVVLFAVHSGLQDSPRTFDFSAFGNAGQDAKIWTITDREGAGEPDVANSFADPERIAMRESTKSSESPTLSLTLPALSVTAIEWGIQHEQKRDD